MIKINKLFIPYIAVLLILGFKGNITVSLFFVILHEMVHYLVAKKYGFSGFYLEIKPIGTILNLKDLNDADPREDFIISISGPIFNICCGLVFFIINFFYKSELIYICFSTNIALGLFNLLPAFPLDGGRIFRDILAQKTLYKRANRITVKISMLFGILVIFIFSFLMLFGSYNFSICVIGIFIIYASYKEKERIVYIIMADVIRKKTKFSEKGFIENKSISIHFKKDLLKAMSILDKNKYNIFYVLNEEMKLLDIIYEEELIKALKCYGNITIENYIKILKNVNDNNEMGKLSEKALEEWEHWSNN
ncbi:M50 family metallopeptidase [Clostridium sediminicola]|uniref:M50 family metallopeptidase n=1 Tax=Clostridium sediminicola TaxID=3114879 RepID=UPI0031F24061